MKILLVAVNAKYIHSNPAIYSLRAYAKEFQEHIELAEYTINHESDVILQDIYRRKPEIIAFSCYIWNIETIKDIAQTLHLILPEARIWFGGPEVSYDMEELFAKCSYLEGIMRGEGEVTFREVLGHYINQDKRLDEIKGIAYRGERGECKITATREPMNMDEIPFVYEHLEDFENRILYYETSRGCPYSCSYCLSSLDKSVRFRSMDLVRKELKYFLENKVPQVKFVDRTFNCNRRHAREIWEFIQENDNGITNFHFEISADLWKEEDFELIHSMREGLVQFEIGVQSTNPDTLKAIHRTTDMELLKAAVASVEQGKNIHQHLDLIVGLPYEDFLSFRRSFNDVYAMHPDQLQLGFLKVLKGSYIQADIEAFQLVFHEKPPYEVLSTAWIRYDEILELKKVEEMVEIYYNTSQFCVSMAYLEHLHETPFDLYHALGTFYEKRFRPGVSHSRMQRYQILADYCDEISTKEKEAFRELLLYDLYARENLKNRPVFARDQEEDKEFSHEFYRKEELREKYLPDYLSFTAKQVARMTHLEHFHVDIQRVLTTGEIIPKDYYLLFDYNHRSPLNHDATVIEVGVVQDGET